MTTEVARPEIPIEAIKETLLLLGYLNTRYGQHARAIVYYELVSVLDPSNAGAWRGLATGRLATGDAERAAECARKAVQHAETPGDEAAAHLLLALALAASSEADAAREHVDAYLATRPQAPDTVSEEDNA